MKILILNAGSSSLKYKLFNKKIETLADGLMERIGQNGETKNHSDALKKALDHLKKTGVITSLKEITAVGHRVVHGGDMFKNPVRINAKVEKQIKSLFKLAPLHNPHNLKVIESCSKTLKKIPQVAVFDTAFHESLPEKAFIYPLPYNLYKKDKIRKYGFHGTSHAYVSNQTAKLLKKKKTRIVVCHLGNGSSVSAVLNGKSVDTSMGFTPLEGIPMGTRSGDIDPAIPLFLIKKLNRTPEQVDEILNKKSGLLGISNLSSDMRDLWANNKKPGPKLALEVLCYRLAKYIASYTVPLQGLDAITFTGGIGEHAHYIRTKTCENLKHLGIKLDQKLNKKDNIVISDKTSKVKIFVIPTDEEKQIAIETIKIVK
ncbi:acetate/propionate family kinase [Candidatus Peregrinibacteria bacterium]|nr:acetate/propionate family kinase [Candidatus Peregrinibacteria bacterium]